MQQTWAITKSGTQHGPKNVGDQCELEKQSIELPLSTFVLLDPVTLASTKVFDFLTGSGVDGTSAKSHAAIFGEVPVPP